VLLRLLGRLDEAYEIANEAVRQARFTGDREQLLGARVRRAQVLQYLGKADEAVVELTGSVDEAHGREWSALEAFAIQNRGKVYFDSGDFENALADMTAAVFLREKLGASPAEIQAALTAVAVVQSALDAQRGTAQGGTAQGSGAPSDLPPGAESGFDRA
jgi:tetratricopeptide (TPR) repeat protein